MACDLTAGRKVPCKDVIGGIVRAWFVDFGDLGTVTKTRLMKLLIYLVHLLATNMI